MESTMRKEPRLGVLIRAGHDGIESEFYVGGGERAAVVKFDAVAKVENVGAGVGSFPALGQIGNEIHLRVAPDQAAEDQAVEALRLRVGADAGVEIGGHGFDEEVDEGGIGCGVGARAAGDGCECEEKKGEGG